jgi:hypothetical protein
MITLADYLYEVERRKDEIAQAERYRLSLQAPQRNSSFLKALRTLLARLGGLLLRWGSQLQTRDVTRSSMSYKEISIR